MKKTIYILSLLLIGLIYSCSDDDGAYRPTPSEFSVTPTELTVETTGGDKEFLITAGNVGWSITSDQDWVSISKQYGSGDGTIVLTMAKNGTGAQRTANVVVKPTYNLDPVTISITQN